VTAPVIEVQNVGKAYRRFGNELRRFAGWFGVPCRPEDETWVLRHITFRVLPGESVGLIGQNGAGKSTLLKLLAGTAQPSEGTVHSEGRVAALLELGLGFNQELTGRENAVHGAGMMGLPQAQIDALMPAIQDFAEIGAFFDQPMRTYSSGMQMRVAFSVATAVRPEVLIVDEALAVGDAYFVHKCFKRIREFRESGTTLLLVSHDSSAIQSLCDRAILLDTGRMILDGDPREVFDYYNALIAEKENLTVRTDRGADGQIATRSGNGKVVFEKVQLFDDAGRAVEYVGVGHSVELVSEVRVVEAVPRLVYGYAIRDRLGQVIYGVNTDYTGQPLADLVGGSRYVFRARFPAALGPGTYSVSVALSSTETHLVENYEWRDLALVFTVANVDHQRFTGSAWLPPVIEVQEKPNEL
jgi:lipopolysaccharide transport system ATP-binding protein